MKLSYFDGYIDNDNGEWKIIEFGLPNEAVTQLVSPGLSSIIFCGTSFGNIYKSIDGGETWEELNVKWGDDT